MIEILTAMFSDKLKDLSQHVFIDLPVKHLHRHILDVIIYFRRHKFRGQYIVYILSADQAAGHAVKLGGFRVLHHDHSACFFNSSSTPGAIGACTRKDDTDGSTAFIFSK